MGAVAAGMGAVGEEEEEDRSSLAADSAEDSTEEGMVVGIVTISGGIGRGIRTTHIPQFDLRNNMRGNQNNLGKETHDHPENSGKQEEAAQSNNRNGSGDTAQRDQTDNREQEGQKSGEQRDRQSNLSEVCARCGKGGHKPEACGNPVVCSNCQKEGHVARVCSELHPWDHIAPFCGLAAPGQGFFFIHSGGEEEDVKELISCALITITKGSVTGRQLENEFKALAGPTSTWRWYAKKVADNCFQMRFPAGKKVEELSFFTSMQMRTVPDVFFKVEKWSPSIGAKAEMQSAWFRVKGIPIGKRSEKNICRVASFVGLPLQVDKANSKKFDYVRVKIGAKDVAKIPAVVEGMLDFFFYDFEFQREVPIEGMTNVAGNKWVRVDKPGDDHPSPKKPRMGEFQSMPAGSHQKESGTSGTSKGKGLSEDVHMLGQQVGAENSSHGQKVTENMELIEGDSEDKGLQIGDLVSPGCESLQFGAFQINEAKKIWHFQINDNISAAINEYGTNMFLSKSDPLAAIEAKNTILEGKKNYLLAVTQGEHQNKAAEVLRAVVEEDTEEKIISQEPPLVDWSSQEELMEVREEVQGERESDVLVEQESEQELNLSSHEVQLPEATNDKAADEENEQRQSSEIGDQAADFQDSRRQSVRLKNQGQGSVKTTEKAEALLMKKNLEGLQHGMDKDAVEEGAGMLKATALHFHPHEAGADDHGMVLLQ